MNFLRKSHAAEVENGILPWRLPFHTIYVIKMVPLDSPDFYESNGV